MIASRQGRRLLANNIAWVAWVLIAVAAYFIASYALLLAAALLGLQGYFSTTVGLLSAHVLLLVFILAVIAGAYYCVARGHLTRRDGGISRMVSWRDIALGIAGFVIYGLLSMLVLSAARVIPSFTADQAQQLGITTLFGGERWLGFVVLVIITPFFEELLFRGILFSKIRHSGLSVWPTAILVSVLFGLAHGQWNVGLDVFCLSMVACYLRESTDSIWAGVIVHMTKNMIAFYFMFVAMQGIGS